MTTMTRTLRYGKGYSGKLGHKCWAAEITGSDDTYGLRRTFLDPIKVERENFNRARTIINFSYKLAVDGLYELSAEGDRWIVMCYADTTTGEVKTIRISDARIKAWVAALDEGKTNREARVASKGL